MSQKLKPEIEAKCKGSCSWIESPAINTGGKSGVLQFRIQAAVIGKRHQVSTGSVYTQCTDTYACKFKVISKGKVIQFYEVAFLEVII